MKNRVHFLWTTILNLHRALRDVLGAFSADDENEATNTSDYIEFMSQFFSRFQRKELLDEYEGTPAIHGK